MLVRQPLWAIVTVRPSTGATAIVAIIDVISRTCRERQVGQSGRQIDANRALGRERLQDDTSARASDQNVGSKARSQCDAGACPHITPP